MLCTAAVPFLKSIYNYEFSDLGAQIKEKSPLRSLTEVGPIVHLKNFYCPNSLGTSGDAKNILKKFFYLA